MKKTTLSPVGESGLFVSNEHEAGVEILIVRMRAYVSFMKKSSIWLNQKYPNYARFSFISLQLGTMYCFEQKAKLF